MGWWEKTTAMMLLAPLPGAAPNRVHLNGQVLSSGAHPDSSQHLSAGEKEYKEVLECFMRSYG